LIKKSLILITGGAGFVGSTLTNKLLKDNKVIVVDDLSMGTFENLNESENLVKIKGSVTDDKLLIRLFEENDFDYVFHLAAVASVADSIIRPKETHMVNFDSTMNILELLRRNKKSLKRFIFSSSAAVYGDEPTLPKTEISPVSPTTPYGIDKYASERITMAYNKLYDIPTSAVRFFNVYGPKQNPNSPYSGVISLIMESFKNKQNFSVFGNGEQSRDFIYVDDVVEALEVVASSKNTYGEVYNIGTGEKVTLNRLISLMQDIVQQKLKISYKEKRAGDIDVSVADIKKLNSIGFYPVSTLEEGLKKYLDYELQDKMN
jgi:UDP-glucose 4-epimerase